jgi:hypothetical protein
LVQVDRGCGVFSGAFQEARRRESKRRKETFFLWAASETRFLWLSERSRGIGIVAARAMMQCRIVRYLVEMSLRDCHREEIGLIRSRDCVSQRDPERGLDVTLLLLSLVHRR